MTKELLLYTGIYSYTAETIISDIEANKGNDIVMRVNSPGGDVFSGWGIIAKMIEHSKSGNKLTLKIDGIAASMAASISLFADSVEALDVSRFLFHRADMYVSSPEDQAFLNSVNQDLKNKMSSKVDSDLMKEITGYSIDDIFDPEKRLDVWINAKDAKKLGIVNKINKISTSLEASMMLPNLVAYTDLNSNQNKQNNKKKMELSELKAQHPDLCKALVDEAIKAERDRVGAFMKFLDVDSNSVISNIESGKDITMVDIADYSAKKANISALAELEKNNAQTTDTTQSDTTKTDEESKKEAFHKSLEAKLGIKF